MQMGAWIAEGKIKFRTHVVEGLENAPDALNLLFTGGNTGKVIVAVEWRLASDSPLRGGPARPRVHLFADRPDLPAQPRRDGRLQRRQVRRRLLADARAGAAPKARVRRRVDRDRARPPGARRRLRLGAAAQLHPRARGRRGGGDAVLGPGRVVPAPRARRADLRRPRRSTRESFGEFDAIASLGAFEHFCSFDDYHAGRQEAIYEELFANLADLLPDDGPPLPADDGLRPQHDRPRRRLDRRPARLRRMDPGADDPPVPGLVPALRPRADRQDARRPTSASSPPRAAGSTTSRRSSSGASDSPSRAGARPCSRRAWCRAI